MGPLDVLRGAWRLLWRSLGVLELFLLSPGGSPGHSWGDPGRHGDVLGGSLGDHVGDQVPQTLCKPVF